MRPSERPVVLNGWARRAFRIPRYTGNPLVEPEDIVQHQWQVGWFCMQILSYLKDTWEGWRHITPDMELWVLKHALLHDMPEAFTGDIIYYVKQATPEFEQAYADLELLAIDRICNDLPEHFQREAAQLMTPPDGEPVDEIWTLMAQIVKLADKLSVLAKLAEERYLGNGWADLRITKLVDSYMLGYTTHPVLGELARSAVVECMYIRDDEEASEAGPAPKKETL